MGRTVFYLAAILMAVFSILPAAFAETGEPGKVGNLDIKSPLVGTRVYVGDEYKGDADIFIEKVSVGQHTITCRQKSRKVSGTFTVRENETLKLEARFDEGKIVDLEIEKAEAERKKRPEAEKQEEHKEAAAESKKGKQKGPADERRELHLTIMKISFEDIKANDFTVTHKADQRIIRGYAEKKTQTGTLQRNKQNMLMCSAGLCNREWSASFSYVDESGKSDSFRMTWRKTFYDHVTLSGLSKSELEWCVNEKCYSFEDTKPSAARQKAELGRYSLSWGKTLAVIRRADIMKEIVEAGGTVPDF